MRGYVVSRRAWERALNPHPRDRASFVPELNRLLAGERTTRARRRRASTGPGGCRAPELHGWPHARARTRRGRRGWRRRVLLRPDPGPSVGASARDHGLRPVSRATHRRETPVSRGQDRARRPLVLYARSRMCASQRPCATSAAASASRTNCAAWRRFSSEAERCLLLTGTAAPYTWRPRARRPRRARSSAG